MTYKILKQDNRYVIQSEDGKKTSIPFNTKQEAQNELKVYELVSALALGCMWYQPPKTDLIQNKDWFTRYGTNWKVGIYRFDYKVATSIGNLDFVYPKSIRNLIPFFEDADFIKVNIENPHLNSLDFLKYGIGIIVGSYACNSIIRQLLGIYDFAYSDIDCALKTDHIGETRVIHDSIEEVLGECISGNTKEYLHYQIKKVLRFEKGDLVMVKQSLYKYVTNFDLYLSQCVIGVHPIEPGKIIGFIHKQALEDIKNKKVTVNTKGTFTELQLSKRQKRIKKYQSKLNNMTYNA